MPRRQRPTATPTLLKGAVLFTPVSAADEYQRAVTRLFDKLRAETERELIALFKETPSPVLDGATFDASLVNVSNSLINKLRSKYTKEFNELAESATARMIKRTVKTAEGSVKRSLDQISDGLSTRIKIQDPAVVEIVKASSIEAANLIKRVPAKYLDEIAGETMRSITSGRGLQDLQPALERYGVQVRNWSKNVSLDQTRKVYNAVNRAALKTAKIRRAEWIHSGGSNDPRDYHLQPPPLGLNGLIFDLDDPPIIDKRTGERGYPGQLPFCGCALRPVMDLSNDDA